MKNNIIIIILVIVIGMVAFWWLGKKDTTSSILTTSVTTSDLMDAKYIYNLLQQMDTVTLDDKIFANPIFQNLKDNTASLPAQASGRSNPFSIIGTDTVIPTTQSTSSLKAR